MFNKQNSEEYVDDNGIIMLYRESVRKKMENVKFDEIAVGCMSFRMIHEFSESNLSYQAPVVQA